tara:strand:+ start:15869 stop:16489 length:621 start_codon:yes stop_codon:yes gene_type:complete
MISISKTPLFTQEVYSFIMPDHEHWKEQIKNIILVEKNKNLHSHSTTPKEECNVKANRTAWDTHIKYGSISILSQKLRTIIQDFTIQENFDVPKLEIQDCWINWYDKNNYAVPHNHTCHLSLVYFVDVEDTKASFLFHENNNFRLVKKNENSEEINIVKKIHAKDGMVLMFNGNICHSVTPNQTNEERVTLALNFCVVYDEERPSY